MKNKWLILAGAVALTAFSTAQATLISGSVTFAGSVQLGNALNNPVGTVAAATQVLTWSGPAAGGLPYVASSSGNLSAGFLTPVTFATPWKFGVQANLWSYTASDGDVFTFSLSSITSDSIQGSPNTLSITGTGSIIATGPVALSATPGTWTFTTSDPSSGGTFTFQGATGSIPDGGMTVMLLGAALSAMGLLRRKLIA
jgi:hypothetical protein